MTPEQLERLRGKIPSRTKPASLAGDSYDWFSRFIQSGVEGMGELVGITPSSTTEQWRSENPLGAFLSEVGGMAVPYVGWFGVTKKVKAFDNLLDGIGDLNKRPFLTGAAREAARYAPFEAGRVLASQVVGDQDLASMTGEAAINLALGAGIGGVVEGVLAAGTRAVPTAKLAPGLDIAAPTQIQQRYIQQLLDQGTVLPENQALLKYRLKELRALSRAESLPKGYRYVRDIEGVDLPPKTGENLSRLFRPSTSGFRRRLFAQGPNDFPTTQAWQAYAKSIGLPDNFEDYGQFFRVVNFEGGAAPQTSGAVNRYVTKGLQDIGDGWFLGKETEDGLFVMAKKVKGTPDKGLSDDEWLTFKTDSPGQFVPSRQRWANVVIGKNAWVPNATVALDGGPIYNTMTGFAKKFPLTNYRIMFNDPKGILNALNRIMPQKIGRGGNELVERLKEATREYLAPARLQFAKSPRANWIHTAAKTVYDAAETEAQRLIYGAVNLDKNKSLFLSVMRGQQFEGETTKASLKNVIDGLSDAEVSGLEGSVWSAWRQTLEGATLDAQVAEGLISQRVADAAKRLIAVDNEIWLGMNKVQRATGHPETKRIPGHYGVSRQWQGDTRITLRGEDGKVVAIASGFNRRGAQARAKKLQETLAKEGTVAKIAEEFQISEVAEIPKDVRPLINYGGYLLERQGIRGFRWDEEAFTKAELLEALETGVRQRLRLQANLSVEDFFQPDLKKLSIEDPHGYKLLTARLNDMAGIHGMLGKIQNQVVDKIMAPILGSNSATKIAQLANSTMWHLNLGAGKIAFPIANAFTFLQTVVPEVAYITSATSDRLASKYTYYASGGTRGPVGTVGVLNPLTMMKDSFKEMRKPSAKLVASLQRAVNERVIDPRLVEDYIGESAAKLTDLKSAVSSPGGFGSWLKAVSEFLPAASERFSRGHAFTVGYMLGRDYVKIVDEDTLYRFARQFTENTMYLYTTSDRPRLMTTPVGSMFGLFKNWMANYTATLLEYTGEGLAHNNWAPLLWQTAGGLSLGGLSATPLYLVADGFSRAFSNQSLLENTYTAFQGDQEWIGDGLLYGLPPLMSGGSMSLYSQTSSPLANPMRDANMLFSTAHLDRLQYFMKSMGSGWDHWQATGEHPGRNPKFLEQLARALAPTTVYRVIGASKEGAISSLSTGYPILENVGLMEKLFYSAGFNPLELDKAYAVAEELFAKKEAHRAHVSRLGQAYAEAQMNRDSPMMTRVLKEAYASGIDVSSVLRSSQARVAKMTTPMLERNFEASDLKRFAPVLGGPE